jgi:hypothetical protein
MKNLSESEIVPIDPSQSSLITDQVPGATFHTKEYFRHGPDQMFLVRLLKGIIPISDILCIEGDAGKEKYLSYEMPLNNISTNGALKPLAQAELDVLILDYVFNDCDHATPVSDQSEVERSNIMIGKQAHAFFDFEIFANFWSYKGVNKEYLLRDFTKFSKVQAIFLASRLDNLIERFSGAAGVDFIKSVAESVEKTTGDKITVIEKALPVAGGKTVAFQSELFNRLKKMKAFLDFVL